MPGIHVSVPVRAVGHRSRPFSVVIALAAALAMGGCVPGADPLSAPSVPASPAASPPPAPEPATVAAGEPRVPLQCAELAPPTMLRLGIALAPEDAFTTADVSLANGDLVVCPLEEGDGGVSILILVQADPDPAWAAQLPDATESEGIIESRYCYDDIAIATHCGVRLGLEHYAAEVFFNASEPGLIAPVWDATVEELRGALQSMPAPLDRAPSQPTMLQTPESCADIALGRTSAAVEVPWLADPPEEMGWDDAPSLVIDAFQRSRNVRCVWEHRPDDAIGYDRVMIDLVPSAGWAMSRLPAGAALSIPGADEARSITMLDEYGPDARVLARVGDDLILVDVDDEELDGLIDPDPAALAARIVSALIETLTAAP